MQCIACDGRGWVDSKYHGPSVCPLCKGKPVAGDISGASNTSNTYDQVAIWSKLTNDRNANLELKLLEDLEKVDVSNIVAHFVFDRIVTPQGNLYDSMMSATLSHTPPKLSSDQLISRGYVVQQDGKVQTVNDLPVGPLYNHLIQWAGIESYHDWKMACPIEIDLNRKGNPLFMDDNFVAIRVKFKQEAKENLVIYDSFMSLHSQLLCHDIGDIKNWAFV
jgi:hypothetical protein